MNLRPLNDFIVVKVQEESKTSESGIFLGRQKKDKAAIAEVVAVGPGKSLENGLTRPMTITVGNKVLIGHTVGADIEVEGQAYLVLTEGDVFGVL